MNWKFVIALLGVVLMGLALVGDSYSGDSSPTAVASKGESPLERVEHPEVEVGTANQCQECHADTDEDIVAEWFAGKHGKLNVMCFVCHGSTGDDFVVTPTMNRCVGCHADKVETMELPFASGKDCFSCHPSHALSSHALWSEKGWLK